MLSKIAKVFVSVPIAVVLVPFTAIGFTIKLVFYSLSVGEDTADLLLEWLTNKVVSNINNLLGE